MSTDSGAPPCAGCSAAAAGSRSRGDGMKHNLSDRLDSLTPSWSPSSHARATTPQSATSADLAEDKSAGAIIESMQHIGKGVYSGTFSGTLNPTLQDQHGRPKRSINTIIHILNDLLSARPGQCRSSASSSRSGPESPRLVQRLPASRFREARSQAIQENRATRGKMQQLQAMMQQRRDRRRIRRDARFSPYATASSAASSSSFSFTRSSSTASTAASSGRDVQPSVDTPEHVTDAVLYADLMSDNEAEIAPGACVV